MSARSTSGQGSRISKAGRETELAKSIGSKKHSRGIPSSAGFGSSETSGQGQDAGFATQYPLKPPVVHYGTVDGVLPIDIDMTKFYSTGSKMVISGNVTINFLNPPAPGKSQTVTIVVKQDVVGNHSIIWGNTVIGNPQPDVTPGVETVFELTTFDQGFTFHRSGTGSGGGGGTSFPLRYPLSAHSNIGLVTEVFDWNFHAHTATLSGDISVAFSNLPAVLFGQDMKIHFKHDGLAGNRIITFPGTVTNLTTVTIAAGQEAIVVLTTDDAGISFHAYSESGISSGGGTGLLSDLTIDVTKDWATKSITNMAAIQYVDTGAVARGTISGDAGASALRASIASGGKFIISDVITDIAEFNDSVGLKMLGTHVINAGSNEIKAAKHIEFTGFESLIKTTTPGIGMDNVIDNAMIYNVPLTIQTHNFKAAGELLAAISRISSNSGQVQADFGHWKFDIIDEYADFATATTPSPLNDGMVWLSSSDGRFKFRENSVTKELGGGVGKLIHELINDEPIDSTKLTIFEEFGDMILNLPLNEKVRIRQTNSLPSIASFGDSLIDFERTLDMNSNVVDNILRATFGSGGVGNPNDREIYGNSDGLIYNTVNTKIHEFREAGTAFLKMDKNKILPSIDGVLTLGDNDIVTPKRFSSVNAGSGDFSDALLVSGDAEFRSDVFLGNNTLDEIRITGFVGSDIRLLTGKKIMPESVSGEIGHLVKNESGLIGTFGSLQIPTTTIGASSAADADSKAGAFLGAMLYQDNGSPAIPILYIRQNDGKWSSFTGSRDALV